MIFKKNRLIKKADFQRVISKGKNLPGNEIKIFWLENQLAYSRFGIVLARKVFPTAVLRNRCKRLIREAIRKNLPMLKTGFDVVVLVRENFFALSPKKDFFDQFLLPLFRKAGLLVESNV
ncbi:MAG: ribonuclease P protein component [Patescibacteria group bacterium]